MWFYIVLALSAVCCGVTFFLSRRYIENAFNSIDAVLDYILSKEPDMIGSVTGESRISKLTHKARRVLDMYVSDAKRFKEEKERIQSFISDISHQMKTPLSGISMYADLLTEGGLSEEEQKEFIFRIKSGTEKLQWMTEGLIKMSRMEVGSIRLEPSREDIKQTIYDSVKSVIAEALKKEIEISAPELGETFVNCDGKWTREAIVNVLENAIKYSEPSGKIEISIEVLALYTRIIITDVGIGIDRSDMNMIFKRFYRGKNVKDKEGAGLGLYLSSIIMEKQGGYIMADSEPGRGTSFSLFLQNCK